MFNFLNPTILFASFAALIPLIIHLFSRRRVRIVEFSSLKHLRAMQKRQVRRLKIRQLLLLLLRMLIILAVVFAFARPTTEGGYVGSHASVSAVIVLDNSSSMNRFVADGNLFELARERTTELLRTFGESDEVTLIPLTAVANERADMSVGFGSAGTAQEVLARVNTGAAVTNLDQAINHGWELLDRAVNVNKELYIISDRQRRLLPEQTRNRDSLANVYIVDLPIEAPENLGLTDFSFGGELLLPGHEFELSATVMNYSGTDRTDVIASLYLDGNRVAQTDVSVPAGQKTQVRFTRSVASGGFHSGYVELSDDRYLSDNRYYFSFHIPENFNVLVIGDDASARFLTMALNPDPELNQYWSVKQAAPDDMAGVNVWEYDVIVLAGAPQLAPAYVERLKLYVQQGRSVFLTYGAQTGVDTFNRDFSELTGITYSSGIDLQPSRAGYYTLEAVDFRHPIFSVFNFKDHKPPVIKFYTLPKLALNGQAQAIANFSGGRPALVEHPYGRGTVVTFTGPLLPQYTELVASALFVPLVSRTVEYLAADLSSYDVNLFCSDRITRSVQSGRDAAGAMDLITPDGTTYTLEAQEQQGSLVLQPHPTDRPGVYQVMARGREVDRFAVNTDPAEGDLTAVDTDQMAQALGLPWAAAIEPDLAVEAAIAQLRFGRELWQMFLWLAIIFLAAELLLSRGQQTQE
jgi:hypothetical protein